MRVSYTHLCVYCSAVRARVSMITASSVEFKMCVLAKIVYAKNTLR